MEDYIGVKHLRATPALGENKEEGYKVEYDGGYTSWSPKDVFEKSYLKVQGNSILKTNISISESMVKEFIKEYTAYTVTAPNDKPVTIVIATLANGFVITESSACVDPENYDENIGKEICMERIENKVWEYLGFLLQTAVSGIK